MSNTFQHAAFHARLQLARHWRSPLIWVVALIAPIAARYMLPPEGVAYSVLTINGAAPILTPGVIGLQLGVVTAVLMAPLAYTFLRAGPTRRQPWQVSDVTPGPRSALQLGQWVGDVLGLWTLMLVLGLAGVVISAFRLGVGNIAPLQTLLVMVLVAAPALVIVAAIRRVLAMRPLLRGALGDVVFAVIWMMLIGLSVAFAALSDAPFGAMADAFGFAAPVASAAGEPVDTLVIVGNIPSDRPMTLDAVGGVTQPGYLLSRLVWIALAGAAVWASGRVYKAAEPRIVYAKAGEASADTAPIFAKADIPVAAQKPSALPGHVATLARELCRPLWLAGVLLVVALAGLVLPFRGLIGPALILLLIFPLTEYGARWENLSLRRFLGTMPTPIPSRLLTRLGMAIAFAATLALPSAIAGAPWPDLLATAIGVPVVAVGLGVLTRSAIAARLLLLIAWYVYLNLG